MLMSEIREAWEAKYALGQRGEEIILRCNRHLKSLSDPKDTDKGIYSLCELTYEMKEVYKAVDKIIMCGS